MITAHNYKIVIKILWQSGNLREEPDYEVFMDLLDATNEAIHQQFVEKIKKEMVKKE